MELTATSLRAACQDEGRDAGIRIVTVLEPLGGPGAPVKPAVYEGGSYQLDRRWWGAGADRRVADVVVIDNTPSQANRLEAALEAARAEVGLPEILLDLSGLALPAHLPSSISCFRFPHRNADAYLRDAQLGGVAFARSEVGRAVFGATALSPDAHFEWMPQSLLYGFWQSHLGKQRAQTKLARSWVSEIVGVDPAATDTKVKGLKGDPLNLSVAEAVTYDADDIREWSLGEESKKGAKKAKDSLAELGHGQVPVAGAPAGVSFGEVVQQSSVSLAGLRRIHCADPDASAAGRALLVAIGLLAHVDAFGRSFSLRSGCELRPSDVRWTWLGDAGDEPIRPLGHGDAVALVEECAAAAQAAGLPVGAAWPHPLVLLPQPSLAKVIERTWPSAEDE